jgi:hypothetical protein
MYTRSLRENSISCLPMHRLYPGLDYSSSMVTKITYGYPVS